MIQNLYAVHAIVKTVKLFSHSLIFMHIKFIMVSLHGLRSIPGLFICCYAVNIHRCLKYSKINKILIYKINIINKIVIINCRNIYKHEVFQISI